MRNQRLILTGEGEGSEMPTFKIREKMAMKIAAKKSAQGYHVSDERCELCEMPLLSMNGGNAMCKVCPALKKLVQMKNEEIFHSQDDDTRDTAEAVNIDSASRDNEIMDEDMDDTFRPLSDDLADSIVVGHTEKTTNIELARPDENVQPHENAGGICPRNTDDREVEGIETKDSTLIKNDVINNHAQVEETKDDVQLAFQESIVSTEVKIAAVGTKESDEEVPDSSPSSIGGGMDMPTFRIRQRIAMKVAARKTAQGYLVSDKRCDMCEMPLLSMNDIVTCKVCPAIEKWAQKKSEGNVSNNFDGVRDKVETEKALEALVNKLDDKGDTLSMLVKFPKSVKLENAESEKDSDNDEDKASEVMCAVDDQHFVQDDRDEIDAKSEATMNDFVYPESEATESSACSIEGEGIKMPTFRIRQRVAMKILAKMTAHGFLISDKRCDLCEMPLLSMNGNLICKVCPALEKWARKKNNETSSELDVANTSAENAVEETESCDHDLADSVFNDTPNLFLATDNGESESKGESNTKCESIDTLQLCEDSKVLNPINSAEYARSHKGQTVINIQPVSDTEQDLHDALSPCSILTTRKDSFGDESGVDESGVESATDEVVTINAQTEIPLLLNRLKANSLADVEPDLEEKSSKTIEGEENENDATASDVEDDEHYTVVAQAIKKDTSTQDIVVKRAAPGENVNGEKSLDSELNSEEFATHQLHKTIICDDSTIRSLQKARFELKGILAGCNFDLMADTVEKLRSIFNCNLSEAEDFRNMFVDERSQSFESDEQTMLLAMRGWMVTNAHCRRCTKACMVIRPVDGEMMCPNCDDVEAGPAETFPSQLLGSPIQHSHAEPDEESHESPRLNARSHVGIPSQLNKWTTVDRACSRCNGQLMRNPYLETDHPTCGPVLTTDPHKPTYPPSLNTEASPAPLKNDAVSPPATFTDQVERSLIVTPSIQQVAPSPMPPSDKCEMAATDDIAIGDDTKENDILDANMLKELKETMKQIEEAKKFLLSKRTPRMLESSSPPASIKSLQQNSPALMNIAVPSSARAGILKPSGYRTPQLNNSGHQTPHIPGKYFFA